MEIKLAKLTKCRKIMFVTQGTNCIPYFVCLLEQLLAKNISVELHYDNHFAKDDIKTLVKLSQSHPMFSYKPIQHTRKMFVKWFLRELMTYNWYSRRTDQSKFFRDRWANYFGVIFRSLIKLRLLEAIVRSKFVFHLMKWMDGKLSVDDDIRNSIEAFQPDLVIASPANMRRSLEVEYLLAARLLGVPTAIVVLSWDNLTNKGLFHHEPDRFFVWNETHKTELIEIHKTKKYIHVVGASLFEKWFSHRYLGRVQAKPYVLYFGSSINITKNENTLLEKLRNLLPFFVEIKFRPHPKVRINYNDNQIEGVQYLLDSEMVESDEQVIEHASQINGALFCTGINTSAFLDALILNTPVFYFRSEDHSQTQDESAHFFKMAQKGYFLNIDQFEIEQLLNFKFSKQFSEISERFTQTEIFINNKRPSHQIVEVLLDG